ncbi:MAG: aquaporin [Bacteroidota bacterium]
MKKLIVEALGTMMLVLAILLMIPKYSGAEIALGVAFVLMGLIYGGGPISKAHYNPAVTLAFWLRKQISTSMALGYILVQILGAFLGVMLFFYLTGGDFKAFLPINRDSFSIPIFMAELLGTALLVFVILRVATAKSTAGNEYYGLAIGSTVGAGIFAFGPISNAVFNPAVSLAFCLSPLFDWGIFLPYILTQFLAAVLAWGLYRLTADVSD